MLFKQNQFKAQQRNMKYLIEKNDYFKVTVKILKFSGLWVPRENLRWFKKYLLLLFNVSCVSYCLFFTLAEILAVKEITENLSELVKLFNMTLEFILNMGKASVWFYERKKILNLMNNLIENCNFYKPTECFKPKSILKKEKHLMDKITLTFFYLALTVPTTSCVISLTTLFFDNNFHQTNNQLFYNSSIITQKLPYYSWVPFEYKFSKFWFSLAIMYQCLALLICGSMTVGKVF